MSAETRHVRYAFADVVGFTENRTVEAQVEIIKALNLAFQDSAGSWDVIYLPTGDGVCAGIVEPSAPADAHLLLALSVLERIYKWSLSAPDNRRCEVRFGVNESVDVLITDINGNVNLAGSGINQAQRLMSLADGNQIVVGRPVYETLSNRDRYEESFRELRAETKHSKIITAYQYLEADLPHLNVDVPQAKKNSDPIDIELNESLSKPENHTTSGQVQRTSEASEQWREEMQTTLVQLSKLCTEEQKVALKKSQVTWERYLQSEATFRGELRKTVQGTMYRTFDVAIHLEKR